jgi:hypothetical protein
MKALPTGAAVRERTTGKLGRIVTTPRNSLQLHGHRYVLFDGEVTARNMRVSALAYVASRYETARMWEQRGTGDWQKLAGKWAGARAEHAFVGRLELIVRDAGDAPAAPGIPTYGWEVYGGAKYRDLLATGGADSFEAAKAAAEEAAAKV